MGLLNDMFNASWIVLLDNNYSVPPAVRVECWEGARKLAWEHKSTKTHPHIQTLGSKLIYTFFMQIEVELKKKK